MFSSVRQGVFFYSSRGIDGFVKERFFAHAPQRGFRSIAAGLFAATCFFAQAPQGLVALLSLKPRGLFISFARTKETKQRKFAVCTFLPTPVLFSAKQKELASLKQLFVFHAPKSTSALRQKSEAGPYCFFTTSLRSLGVGVFLFCFARFLSSRVERSEVKDLVYIHTTSEAMCPPKRAISGLSGGA